MDHYRMKKSFLELSLESLRPNNDSVCDLKRNVSAVTRNDVKLNEMAFPVRMAKIGRNRSNLTDAPSIKVCTSHRFFFDFSVSET